MPSNSQISLTNQIVFPTVFVIPPPNEIDVTLRAVDGA